MASSPAQTYFWHTRTAPAPAARFSSCRAGPVARRAGGRWPPRRLPPEPPRSGLDDTHSSLGLTRDDELGIDLRTTLGGGGGRYLRQTNSSAIGVFGQLLYNREKGAERKDDRKSLEASLNRQRSVLATDLPQQFRTAIRPPRARPKRDYGIITSLGWAF
jgi:hypothetical protein